MRIKLDEGAIRPVRAHNFIDLTGRQYGYLDVLQRVEDKVLSSGRKKPQYLCKCDCGNTTIVIGESLRNGGTKSCGCHRGDPLIKYSTKHGKRYERIYEIYCGMKKRCYNKGTPGYKNYGGKGITVCDEWLNDFNSFYEWSMANGYTNELTIDRIDNSGNYEPSNCQWITRSENIRKRNKEYWRDYHEGKVRFRGKCTNEGI